MKVVYRPGSGVGMVLEMRQEIIGSWELDAEVAGPEELGMAKADTSANHSCERWGTISSGKTGTTVNVPYSPVWKHLYRYTACSLSYPLGFHVW